MQGRSGSVIFFILWCLLCTGCAEQSQRSSVKSKGTRSGSDSTTTNGSTNSDPLQLSGNGDAYEGKVITYVHEEEDGAGIDNNSSRLGIQDQINYMVHKDRYYLVTFNYRDLVHPMEIPKETLVVAGQNSPTLLWRNKLFDRSSTSSR